MAQIEEIARQTIGGLLLEFGELVAASNDNNVNAWGAAEDKALEIVRITQTVQDGILRRGAQQSLPFDEVL
jgi:hypothetical protein